MLNVTIKDGDGKLKVEKMRKCFEQAIAASPGFAEKINTEADYAAGVFIGYKDVDTHCLWTGFALGMRCMERVVYFERAAALGG